MDYSGIGSDSSSYRPAKILSGLFKNLSDRNKLIRSAAASELKLFAEAELQHAQDVADDQGMKLAPGTELNLVAHIMSGLSALVESTEPHQRLGAIAAMEALLQLDHDMDATTGIRFAGAFSACCV
jgi:hypothetical protein